MIRWAARSIAVGIIFGVIIMIGMTISHYLHTDPMFTVKKIEVTGVSRTDKERLSKIYKPLVGQNIFATVTPHALLTNDQWIARLEMKRVLPDKLMVVVEEEKELISYKKSGKCYSLTERWTEIPVKCEGVRIVIAETPFNEEFKEFVNLYRENELLKNSDITLKKGIFTVYKEGVTYLGNYAPGVFVSNYDAFSKQISARYKSIDRVDITVRGKVYVKGVTNG